MKKALSLTLLAALAINVGCATAQNASAQADQVEPQTEKVVASEEAVRLAKTDISNEELGEKLVCKYEKKTGSQFRKKVCRTKQEVEEERFRSQEALEKTRRTQPRPGPQ